MNSRLRNLCFTSFTVNSHQELFKLGNVFSYMIYSVEMCPKTQKPHIQGYAECITQTRFETVKKALPEKTHIEPRRGTQEQAIEYCSKTETHIDGPFILGNLKKQGKRNDIIEFINDIKLHTQEKDIVEKHPICYLKYNKTYDRIKQLYEIDRDWKTEVHIYWGEPGSGKTRKVFEECPNVQPVQYINNFIIGYNNEENILFDDFNPNIMPRNVFLTLTDRYKCTVNVKGGEKKWNPRKIYITSNYDPQYWYDNGEAVLRRCTLVSQVVVSEVT